MREKTQFFIMLGSVLILFAGCIAYYYFNLERLRFNMLSPKDEREFNAVIGRYFKFDSIIIGTSMSENFKCSEFDKVTGGYSQKLTTSGGIISEIAFMADYAFKHQQIKNVLLDILPYSYLSVKPEYEIDQRIYNNSAITIHDLVNGTKLSTIVKYQKSIRNNVAKKSIDRDTIYSWSKQFPCGLKPFAISLFAQSSAFKNHGKFWKNYDRKLACSNIDNYLLPMIKNHPDTIFYVYLPPCSILDLSIDPKSYKDFRNIIMDKLIPCQNVKLYDFQSAKHITADWSNYKDVIHYSAEISSWIIRQLDKAEYRVTTGNRYNFEKRFDETVAAFDHKTALMNFANYYNEHCK